MPRSTQFLLAALGLAGVAWVLSRTQRGQVAAADAADELGEVAVGVKKIGAAVGAAVARVFTPRGIRNNNPGNIEWIANPSARWRGMIDADGRYGIFDSPANGVRAIGGELRASIRKGQTIKAALYEWAPPTENDSDAYAHAVAAAVGAGIYDKLTNAMLPAAALAIIRHENGQQPYNPADVAEWVYLA